MVLLSTVGMQQAGWAATNDSCEMINALKLCRIWFITQPELAWEGGPSPAVVLCFNNQQDQLNFMKDK